MTSSSFDLSVSFSFFKYVIENHGTFQYEVDDPSAFSLYSQYYQEFSFQQSSALTTTRPLTSEPAVDIRLHQVIQFLTSSYPLLTDIKSFDDFSKLAEHVFQKLRKAGNEDLGLQIIEQMKQVYFTSLEVTYQAKNLSGEVNKFLQIESAPETFDDDFDLMDKYEIEQCAIHGDIKAQEYLKQISKSLDQCTLPDGDVYLDTIASTLDVEKHVSDFEDIKVTYQESLPSTTLRSIKNNLEIIDYDTDSDAGFEDGYNNPFKPSENYSSNIIDDLDTAFEPYRYKIEEKEKRIHKFYTKEINNGLSHNRVHYKSFKDLREYYCEHSSAEQFKSNREYFHRIEIFKVTNKNSKVYDRRVKKIRNYINKVFYHQFKIIKSTEKKLFKNFYYKFLDDKTVSNYHFGFSFRFLFKTNVDDSEKKRFVRQIYNWLYSYYKFASKVGLDYE